jgi:Cu-processing system ATP-binding protein
MIVAENLIKTYGKIRALNDISVKFGAGQAVSLLGPNGSGKTTLIKSILGLVIPEKGNLTVLGKKVRGEWQYRSRIGYMPQIGRYPENMNIGQVIRMLKELRKDCNHYDEEMVESLGISGLYDKPMRSLSGGTRQKVSACLVFLFNPEVLILDEPTAGLDPLSSEILKAKITRECAAGKLILITSHILSDLEGITSDILYLQDGNLVFYKTVDELKTITGEDKLNKVMASMMQHELPKMGGEQ